MNANRREWSFEKLVAFIRQVHEELAAQAGRAVNLSLTLRNWLIGSYIAEYEFSGADRAGFLWGQSAQRAFPGTAQARDQ